MPKPDPAPYLKIVESAGISKCESVVIEDSRVGVMSAAAAGIPVIHLDRYDIRIRGVSSVRNATRLSKWRNAK